MSWTDAIGQELDLDNRVAHLSSSKTANGNVTLRGTIVGFTHKLVQVLIDGEDKPKNLNNWKLVLIKDQTPFEETTVATLTGQ
jgi:hypothetical protein